MCYFLNGGRVESWWKGRGSYIDYWNPDAVTWWHSLMDKVLDMGIDGWKVDMTDADLDLWLWLETADGPKLPFEYTQAYYRDFFEYTREKLGTDRVIDARPVDTVNYPWGRDFAPREVSFYGWVGDQDNTFDGMKAALKNMFMSANRGHLMFGSDIGGYRGGGLRDKELLIRWAQLGALCPVMENGGGGDHRPWMIDEETTRIYRDFVLLHQALAPYIYSESVRSWNAGISVMRPLDRYSWEYMLGDNLLVAPMTESGTARTVAFPGGAWIDIFDGTTHGTPWKEALEAPLDRMPVYAKAGAIIPMDLREGGVFDDATGLAPLTVSIYPGDEGSFDVYEEAAFGTRITYHSGSEEMKITLSATPRRYAFRLHGAGDPASIVVNPAGELAAADSLSDLPSSDTGYYFDGGTGQLWIKPGETTRGLVIRVKWPQ